MFPDHPLARGLLGPCLVDGLLAPTNEQRLKYKNWLHVYAKSRTKLPPRAATLVDSYNVWPFILFIPLPI